MERCRISAKKLQSSVPGSDLVNTEQSIMASFDFLASETVDDDDDDDDDGMANGDGHNGHDVRTAAEQMLANRFKVSFNGDGLQFYLLAHVAELRV